MPRPFETAILTDAGARLLTRSLTGEITVEFTKMAVGNGEYDAAEKSANKLQKRTELMSQKNSYPFSDISIHDEHSVKLTSLISNQDPATKDVLVDEGYYINEIGIFAKENGNLDAAEVLYCISITSGDRGDYLPAYNGHSPAQITQDFFATVGNSGEVTIHSAGAVLLRDGDAKDVTVTFAEAEERENIGAGEKLSVIFGKIMKFFADLKKVAFSGDYNDLSNIPTEMKNPKAITFTGGVTGSYDGSEEKSVAIPTSLPASDVAEWAKEPTKPSYNKSEVGLGNVGNFKAVSTAASQELTDTEKKNARENIGAASSEAVSDAVSQANQFTLTKISNLINGAPETLDTLKEISDAIQENEDVVTALNSAVGNKLDKTGDASNTSVTFTEASSRTNISSKEKLSIILGKIKKYFADLKTVAFSGSYNDLEDQPIALPANGGTANYLNPILIPANASLSAKLYQTPGFYYCPANATAATLSNCPTKNAFFMIVGKHAGVYQEIIEYITSNPKRWMRNYYNNTWGSWYRVYTEADKPANTTYNNFVKSGSGAKAGLVPAPSTTAGTTKYLREDGTWAVPPDTNTTYPNATTSVKGIVQLVDNNSSNVSTLAATPKCVDNKIDYKSTWKAISIRGTGNLSVSSVFASSKEIVIQLFITNEQDIRMVYAWSVNPNEINNNGETHLISGYKFGSYEGFGEVAILGHTTAKIVNMVLGGTQSKNDATLVIRYR